MILILGDGMGPPQVGLLSMYARHAVHSETPDRTAAIELLMNLGGVGLMRTNPSGALVTDSAASATQLATGKAAGSEMIGATASGDRAPTIVEAAHAAGKSTGVISDTRATHATPGAFYAHQPHRQLENEIAADFLQSGLDVLLSGGLRHWVPEAVNDRTSVAYEATRQMVGDAYEFTSRRRDNRNLLLEARGEYQLAFDRHALASIESGRVLGLFADSEMHDALAERAELLDEQRTEPTLVEMSLKAIEILDQNPKGFFLMIEGGQIDWAGHNNDAGTMLHELLQLDDCVRAVYEWAKDRDDTLIVVTADHETGSMGVSFSGSPLPRAQRLEGEVFRQERFQPQFNFAAHSTLDRLFAQKCSFYTLFTQFDALPSGEQTPEQLQRMVAEATPFRISLQDAVDILTRMPNPSYAAGHPYLGTQTVPLIRDFSDFYVYGENLRMNALGRKLAHQQNMVWGTGTHTATPVPLVSWGPKSATQRFTGMPHSTDVGKSLIELVQ
ncbi:MAG: alkaline phosphatase [Planctomycetales bacterium]|nr:alkaline phosphatase [Planctomycetales bacterium]